MYEGGDLKNRWLGFIFSESLGKLEVSYVAPNSPADIGGMRSGDSILSVDSLKFESLRDLQYYILQRKSMVKISYKGIIKTIKVIFIHKRDREILLKKYFKCRFFKEFNGSFFGVKFKFSF